MYNQYAIYIVYHNNKAPKADGNPPEIYLKSKVDLKSKKLPTILIFHTGSSQALGCKTVDDIYFVNKIVKIIFQVSLKCSSQKGYLTFSIL